MSTLGEKIEQPASGTSVNDDTVAAFLRENPDFLVRNQDLVTVLTPPGRWDGENGGVVDMQQFMLEQLRRESDNLRDAARHVIDTSRDNMAVLTRVHTAILVLLGAGNLEDLIRMIGADMLLPLDVDAAALGLESGAGEGIAPSGFRRLAPGYVDAVLGPDTDVQLVAGLDGGGELFGDQAPFIRSAAFARLRPGPAAPGGILALGSRGAETFHPAQGSDLLAFLARVVERLTHRFLEGTG